MVYIIKKDIKSYLAKHVQEMFAILTSKKYLVLTVKIALESRPRSNRLLISPAPYPLELVESIKNLAILWLITFFNPDSKSSTISELIIGFFFVVDDDSIFADTKGWAWQWYHDNTSDIMNGQTEDIIYEDTTNKLFFYFSSKYTFIRVTIFLRDVYWRAIKV